MLAPAALLTYFFVLKKDDRSDKPDIVQLKPLKEAIDEIEPESGESSESELTGEDLEAERIALRSVLNKVEDDHRDDVINDETYRALKSKYGDKLKQIDAELKSSQQVDELEDLRAEEVAIRSVLDKVASDHEKGLLSERAYNRLKDRYEERLAEIRTELGKS
jgi:hypothetical protein